MKVIREVCIAGITFAALTFAQAGQAAQVQYEYRIISVGELSASGAADSDRQRSLEGILNKLGSEGWELPAGTSVGSVVENPDVSKEQLLQVIPPGQGGYLLLKRQIVVPAQ